MPTADCIGASQKALGGSTAKARQAKEAGFKYGVETMSDVLDTQQQEFKAKKRTLQNKMQLHHCMVLVSRWGHDNSKLALALLLRVYISARVFLLSIVSKYYLVA